MAVKIRLKRIGKTKQPYYRVVVADSRFARDGRFIEEVGTYNPLVDPAEFHVDMEKVGKWIKNGAQMTETVKSLIRKASAAEVKEEETEAPKTKTKAAGKKQNVENAEISEAEAAIGQEETK